MKNLFKKWISGEVNWTEEQQLRQSAKTDAFMAEAMEGYDAFPESDHAAKINELNQRVARLSKRERGLVFYLARVAAAAAIIGIIGSFFWLQNEVAKPKVLSDTIEKLETVKPLIPNKKSDNNFAEISDFETKNNNKQPVDNQLIVKNDLMKIESGSQQNSASKIPSVPISKYSAPSPKPEKALKKPTLSVPSNEVNLGKEKTPVSTAWKEVSKSTAFAKEEKRNVDLNRNKDAEFLDNTGVIEPVIAEQEKKKRIPTSEKERELLSEEEIIKAIADVEPPSSFGSSIESKKRQKKVTATKSKKKRSAINLEGTAVTPRPKGGFLRFERFLKKNTKYPQKAKEQGIEIEIEIQFYINKKGIPTNFSTTNKEDFGFEQEAIRLLKKGPKWKPVERDASYVFGFELKKE